jgi:hypothetical protein
MEILALDSRLAYFDDLCFACSPFLPLIISYRNNSFLDGTAKFPRILEQEIQETLKERDSGFDLRGNALKYLALHIILGKEAAIYVASGTMANQLAIKSHTEPGDEVIIPSVVRLRHNAKKKHIRSFRVSRHGVYARDKFYLSILWEKRC